ncbi:Hca operon transcriptional activator [Delftia tsuruhatensis]|uniref:LysR family transcriptional regulator n=1 Tax=Delftia tsuruhatensis TaxID=180282 RepID=UPI001E7A748D|nr:LysR family transcriptional regulator [Delftia tsuruhatensis]CAB5711080.1 Hca operon transcriptional activator [Delftia tsuruhatensis]CAC9686643.1 Hca operon transcriptional activator [Delftia tsuruhatensis]
MDLRQLRHFVTLARTLNYRQAAEQLHMSQPPLSQSIRRLEDSLGVQLFQRDRRGTALTEAGLAALESAEQALHHARQVQEVSQATASGERGRLHMGFIGSATFSLIPRLVQAFRAQYPLIDLVLTESTTREICMQVASGEFDAGLLRYPVTQATELAITPIEKDELVAVLPEGNPLARQPGLRLRDLASQPFINYRPGEVPGLHALVVLACQQAGFMPQVKQHAVQAQTLVSLVGAGLGVALVPAVVAKAGAPGVVFRHLADAENLPAIGLALALNQRQPVATARHLLALLQRLAP